MAAHVPNPTETTPFNPETLLHKSTPAESIIAFCMFGLIITTVGVGICGMT